ncbi:MAG: Uma2 family endonuclease [Peptococcaceae bacterium]|nr:Uma2 family endonuclease [Peptococcaceae bacterium]
MQLASERIVTKEEWFGLPEWPKTEVLDSIIIRMDAPSISHQRVLRNIAFEFSGKMKVCETFIQTNLVLDAQRSNFLIPDIQVVCDPSIIKERAVEGIPFIIAEIISNSSISSIKRDLVYKMNLYQKYKVPYYLAVDIENKTVLFFCFLENNIAYSFAEYNLSDSIKIRGAEDMEIQVDVSGIFAGI